MKDLGGYEEVKDSSFGIDMGYLFNRVRNWGISLRISKAVHGFIKKLVYMASEGLK